MRSLLRVEAAPPLGRLKYVAAYSGSLAGLQEPQVGWLLLNGAVVPAAGNSPLSGRPYAPLRAALGTRFGAAGTLPDVTGGKILVPRGTVGARTFNVGEMRDASQNQRVTLTLAQASPHRHRFSVTDPGGGGSTYFFGNQAGDSWQSSTGYGSEPFDHSDMYQAARATSSLGGGGSHDNMPPIIVVGAVLVKF